MLHVILVVVYWRYFDKTIKTENRRTGSGKLCLESNSSPGGIHRQGPAEEVAVVAWPDLRDT